MQKAQLGLQAAGGQWGPAWETVKVPPPCVAGLRPLVPKASGAQPPLPGAGGARLRPQSSSCQVGPLEQQQQRYLERCEECSRFPDRSAGKESTCNAGDPSSTPGSGRSAGEGIDYPLHCSWASLVTQLVKNPPAMWETWVRGLGWKDLLEKGKATHSSILAWRIPCSV